MTTNSTGPRGGSLKGDHPFEPSLAWANPSLERTPPRREFMIEAAQRRRSARDRYAAFLLNAWIHQ